MRKNIIIFSILVTLIICTPVLAETKYSNTDLLSEIKDILWNYYYERPPYEMLKQNSINGVLASLNDPYTKYYNEQEFHEFWFSLEGKVAGVGLTIEKKREKIIVTKVLPNTPAAEVYMQKGDIITHINGTPLGTLSLEQVTELFRGKPGTYLRLQTFRPSTNTYFNYFLNRQYIEIQPIEATILSKNIGYIKIVEFNKDAAKDFTFHLNNFKAANIRGLILDLRDNPGGLIGAALDIAAELIPPGPFVQLVYRGEDPDLITTVGTYTRLPLIVLTNANTASSAEILAGAIQDRNVGLIVGTPTFGKASVQSLIPLVNGGALKFTSGKYLTPNGKQINKIGLRPDLFITDPQEQVLGTIWLLDNDYEKSIFFQVNSKKYISQGKINSCTTSPYLANGHLMLPLRSLIEALGGSVQFISPDKIKVTLKNNQIDLTLNSRTIYYNGQEKYMPVKAKLKKGYTQVPLRSIAELLETNVKWRAKTGQVVITF